MNTDIVKSHT